MVQAEQVRFLKLKHTARSVAYILIELLGNFRLDKNEFGDITIYKPFDIISGGVKRESSIRIVSPQRYMDMCVCVDHNSFISEYKNNTLHLYRLLCDTLSRLKAMGYLDKLCFYKVVSENSNEEGYILGYDFTGYGDISSLSRDWFFFSTKVTSI